jgi:hypothetical protein
LRSHDKDVADFQQMLNTWTNSESAKFDKDSFAVDMMHKHWSNTLYGGSILTPIHNFDKETGEELVIENNL